jgi:hypothetical protein
MFSNNGATVALRDGATPRFTRYGMFLQRCVVSGATSSRRLVAGRDGFTVDGRARAGHPLRCGIASCVALSEAFSPQAASSVVIQPSIEAS